jgi:alanine racemase
LTHNLTLARRAAANSKVWAVVKANAYGHGIERVFGSLSGADGFAVLDMNEAVRLRDLGWSGPILLLEGFFELNDLIIVAGYQLTPVIHSAEQLVMLEVANSNLSGIAMPPLNVYLKCNSGMNRLGLRPAVLRTAYARLRALHFVKDIALMTHFACADEALGIQLQLDQFAKATGSLPGARSLCNSAGVLRYPEAHADWIRPGIMLYGSSPFADASAESFGLQAAQSLHSRLIAVHEIKAGEGVGYGYTFIAPSDMRIGVVACGYADGYPRHAPNGTPVLVDGVRCSLAGRLSMDMMTVDLTAAPEASVGSEVELWGQRLPIDEVAQSAGTVGYELMCALAPRVPVQVVWRGQI